MRPGLAPWVGKIPWRRAWQPTAVFLPGESPWTEEPGGLQSMGSQRVGYDRAPKHREIREPAEYENMRNMRILLTEGRLCISYRTLAEFLWSWCWSIDVFIRKMHASLKTFLLTTALSVTDSGCWFFYLGCCLLLSWCSNLVQIPALLLTMWLWVGYLTSLSFCFLTYKMEMLIVPTTSGLLWRLKEIMCAWCWAWTC